MCLYKKSFKIKTIFIKPIFETLLFLTSKITIFYDVFLVNFKVLKTPYLNNKILKIKILQKIKLIFSKKKLKINSY